MIDDKTGKPSGKSALQLLVLAYNGEVEEMATKNFARLVLANMRDGSPEQIAQYERSFVELFDGIMPGWGTAWMPEVFQRAQALLQEEGQR
jgi:hypothetical protein